MGWQKCSGIKRSYLGFFPQNKQTLVHHYKLMLYPFYPQLNQLMWQNHYLQQMQLHDHQSLLTEHPYHPPELFHNL
ncbi:hypothetical protein GYM05_004272 [Shigella sonnei]|nr:hypothetical protein [Shigella sonnei]QBQ26235.1 hypothetical protein CSW73_012935 [Shigella sonnei]QDI00468.1 hypothetical protein FKX80_14615 [Shigella sonnei]THD83871.1 hypothetical protein E5F65_23755 [Shigella sonnei]